MAVGEVCFVFVCRCYRPWWAKFLWSSVILFNQHQAEDTMKRLNISWLCWSLSKSCGLLGQEKKRAQIPVLTVWCFPEGTMSQCPYIWCFHSTWTTCLRSAPCTKLRQRASVSAKEMALMLIRLVHSRLATTNYSLMKEGSIGSITLSTTVLLRLR